MVIELQGADNVRDLGGLPLSGGRSVLSGLFYRGSSLHRITESDHARLFDDLGIRCVIDLRCGWERDEKPNAVHERVAQLHIPFYDKKKVGIEYTEPADGGKVVGRDVACEPLRFYGSLANPLTVKQMREGVHAVFERTTHGKPVYFHCSGGKDRAGIIAALLLYIMGASEQTVLEDYLFTNVSRDKKYDELYAHFLRLSQGDEEQARYLTRDHRAKPENLQAFYQAIFCDYGTLEDFIVEQLGITPVLRSRIIETCTCPA